MPATADYSAGAEAYHGDAFVLSHVGIRLYLFRAVICLLVVVFGTATVRLDASSRLRASRETARIYMRNLLGWLRLGWLKIA